MVTVIIKPGLSNGSSLTYESSSLYMSQQININFVSPAKEWRPSMDVYESDTQFIVLLELSGTSEENIRVQVDRKLLTISGIRPFPLPERMAIQRMEIPFGEFFTEVEIPSEVDYKNIQAVYDNGFLMVFLPKNSAQNIQIQEG